MFCKQVWSQVVAISNLAVPANFELKNGFLPPGSRLFLL